MRNLLKLLLLVTCHLSLVTFSAYAEIVNKISVSGNRRMDEESVRILAGVKTGDNISKSDLNQIAKKLKNSGYFSDVSADISGGTLKISVSESAIIGRVAIEGNNAISADDLRREVRTAARGNYDESTIGADVRRMLAAYQRKGYFGTKIEPQRIDNDGKVDIVFEVKEGNPTYLKDISFEGNEKFSNRTLRGEILSREEAWWRVMTQFDVYDADRLQYDRQMLGQFYLRHGYADVRVDPPTGFFSKNRKYYSAKFKIVEGKKYKFGNLSISNPFKDVPDDELEEALKMNSGDTYNADLVEGSSALMRATVAKYGYSFINVNPQMTRDAESGKIDIKFEIQKTARIYTNAINILGNVRTFDSVIGHQTNLRSGDPFSLQAIEEGRQKMMRSRYYKSVDMVPTRVAESENLMNLDIKVEEQPTGELSGGLGWSNINGFMVDAGITETNFMGRGQMVQLKGSVAQYLRQVMFSFTEPYMFDRELSGGFDISYTMFNYGRLGSYGFNRDSFTVAGRLGWRISDHWTQGLRISAMWDQNYDLRISGGWQNAELYTIGTHFKYQNLDTDFSQNTHDGLVATFGLAYTGFGSTSEFLRYNGDLTGLLKFLDNRWQLKSTVEFGYIQEVGGDYLPRVYRYFLGGESLRGFDIAGVGSRNWLYRNYALGGLWKVNGTTQMNFPVFIPDEYQVKGFVFSDYGVLGKPPKAEDYYIPGGAATCPISVPGGCRNFTDNALRLSAGVGVYWNTPMGPMNFSWGWPIISKGYDREQLFLLSFATQF